MLCKIEKHHLYQTINTQTYIHENVVHTVVFDEGVDADDIWMMQAR